MRLVVVTADTGRPGRGHADIASAALAAGCKAVQLRDKRMCDRDFCELAGRVKEECDRAGALFFVNDRVDAALVVGASGVHLGVGDMSVSDARSILPRKAIIGFSPESLDEARQAVRDGADYLGVGPVYVTRTKPDAGRPIGLEGLARYCGDAAAPVIAVGGIDANNVSGVFEAGASGAAVSSAVWGAPDMFESVRLFVTRVNGVSARGA